MFIERTELDLQVFFSRIEEKELDLQPDYQRGDVWNRDRQQKLIDTILRGWYIPAIFIVGDEHSDMEQVLDGQQRLQTVAKFFRDELKVNGRTQPHRDDIFDLHGKLFSQLPDQVRRRVRRFPISVVKLRNYSPDEPSELFFRLNQQYSLTPSEKRNALYGDARDQVRKVVDRLRGKQVLLDRSIVGFSNGRLAYDDVISRCCVAVEMGTMAVQLSNHLIEDFYRERIFSDDTLTSVRRAGEALGAALLDIGGSRLNKASLLSWLLFSRSLLQAGEIVKPSFVQDFENRRMEVKAGEVTERGTLSYAVEAFDDRSSYRVNDTTPVILRDLALHAAHAALDGAGGIHLELLRQFERFQPVNEARMSEIATSMNWGAL